MGWAGFYPHPPQAIAHLTTTWFVQIREGGGDPWGYLCLHENYDKNLSLRVFILLLKKELGQYSPLLVQSGLHKLIPVFFWGERNFSDIKSLMSSHFSSSLKKNSVDENKSRHDTPSAVMDFCNTINWFFCCLMVQIYAKNKDVGNKYQKLKVLVVFYR